MFRMIGRAISPAFRMVPVVRELSPLFRELAESFHRRDTRRAKEQLLELEAKAEEMALEKLRGG